MDSLLYSSNQIGRCVHLTLPTISVTNLQIGAEANESAVQGRQETMSGNTLVGKVDIISHISTFTADDQFLFFGSVSTDWRRAWGKPSKTTKAMAADTSVSMLEDCFACGLGDSSAVCENAARLGRLDLLQCARAHFCPFGETCTVAYKFAHNTRTQKHYLAYTSLFRWARAKGYAWNLPVSK